MWKYSYEIFIRNIHRKTLALIKMQPFRPAILLRRDTNTGDFLKILQSFKERLLLQNNSGWCFVLVLDAFPFLYFISSFCIILKIKIFHHFPNTLITIKCSQFLKLFHSSDILRFAFAYFSTYSNFESKENRQGKNYCNNQVARVIPFFIVLLKSSVGETILKTVLPHFLRTPLP